VAHAGKVRGVGHLFAPPDGIAVGHGVFRQRFDGRNQMSDHATGVGVMTIGAFASNRDLGAVTRRPVRVG
jgi:hypothetical protein